MQNGGEIESTSSDDEDSEDIRQYKVILLGDGAVGKTSIANRLTSDNFQQLYKQTIGLDFFLAKMSLPGNVEVTLQLWDIGGQSIGGKMIQNYIAGAHAVVMCYDITNYSSFENVEDWYRLVKRVFPINRRGARDSRTGGVAGLVPTSDGESKGGEEKEDDRGPLVCLMGNKLDMQHMRQVDEKKVQAFVRENNFLDFKVSAKTGDNINTSFYEICSALAGVLVPKNEMDCQGKVMKAVIIDHKQHDETIEGGKLPDFQRKESNCLVM